MVAVRDMNATLPFGLALANHGLPR